MAAASGSPAARQPLQRALGALAAPAPAPHPFAAGLADLSAAMPHAGQPEEALRSWPVGAPLRRIAGRGTPAAALVVGRAVSERPEHDTPYGLGAAPALPPVLRMPAARGLAGQRRLEGASVPVVPSTPAPSPVQRAPAQPDDDRSRYIARLEAELAELRGQTGRQQRFVTHVAPSTSPGTQAEPEPEQDLDALARQVLPIVRRLLNIERERRPGRWDV
jgi:hypothetical protein